MILWALCEFLRTFFETAKPLNNIPINRDRKCIKTVPNSLFEKEFYRNLTR